MSETKELKEKEFVVELKFAAILSVNEAADLRIEIPKLIEKRLKQYNYPYLVDKPTQIHTMNSQAYIRCRISRYEEISAEERAFINSDVIRAIRSRLDLTFSPEQGDKLTSIYRRKEKKINEVFNESPFWSEKNLTTRYNKKELKRIKEVKNDG